MSEPLLAHARNIYEQQTHNRRMTWLLIVSFVILIALIGAGFDIFFDLETPIRFLMLPFVILMVGSGIWNFRHRAAAGLWKEPQAFAEDESDFTAFKWGLIIIFIPAVIIIIFLFFLPLFAMNPHFIDHPDFAVVNFFSRIFKISIFRYLPVGTAFAVIIGIISIFTSLRWGMNSVLWSVQAESPDEYLSERHELLNIVKEMSLAAGMPSPPHVFIVRDSDPNAFTLGTLESDSSIIVTSGLLDMLNREELQGVVAHELSHIRNADTRLMTTITVLFGAVILLSGWMKRCALLGGFTGSKIPGAGWALRGIMLIGWIATLVLAPLIARIVAMAVSRQREYLADAGGAELTRNPKALAGALLKIENAAAPTTSFQKGIAHLCVVDPLGKKINSKEGWWANLFATHPPMKNRVMLLNSMAYDQRQH